jgi:FkbM family methyltransferase
MMHRITASALRCLSYLLANRVFTIRSGLSRGLKRRYGFGFKPRLALIAPALSAEERFVEQLDLTGKTVFDVGAYIGIYTMYFARAVGENGTVVAFEPHSQSYHELISNVRLNGMNNVISLNLAVGNQDCQSTLFCDSLLPTRTTLLDKTDHKALSVRPRATATVQEVTLDTLVRVKHIPVPDLIKIDVEGYELHVLYGAETILRQSRPAMLIELHGDTSQGVVEYLAAHDYAIYHIESNSLINRNHMPPRMNGQHLFCWAGDSVPIVSTAMGARTTPQYGTLAVRSGRTFTSPAATEKRSVNSECGSLNINDPAGVHETTA